MRPKLKSEKRYQNNNNFLHFKNKSKSAPQICIIFPSILHPKIHRNNVDSFFHENYLRKSSSKWYTIFASQNYVEKVLELNGVEFSLIEVALNKARWKKRRRYLAQGNYLKQSTSKQRPYYIEKDHRNNVEIYRYFLFDASK